MTRIIYSNGYLELRQGVWHPSAPSLASLANVANALSQEPFYSYSPSHGGYGPLLAHQIAEKIGGKVEVQAEGESKEPPAGVVF